MTHENNRTLYGGSVGLGQGRSPSCEHGFLRLDAGSVVDGTPGCVDLVNQLTILRPVVPVDQVVAHLCREPAGSSDHFCSLHGSSQRADQDRKWSCRLERHGQGCGLLATGVIEVRVRETAKASTGIECSLPMTAEIDDALSRSTWLVIAID